MIDYTFTVAAVDPAARVMEIVYKAAGKPEHRIGARLPYEGESVEAVAEQYSPVWHWLEQDRTVSIPPVGVSGVLRYNTPVASGKLSPEESANIEMAQEIEYERRLAKALIKFGVLDADPTAIPQAVL